MSSHFFTILLFFPVHVMIPNSKILFIIITGDLTIVDNQILRKLFSRRPKFREPKQLDFESAKVEILKGVDKCTYQNS